MTTQNGLMYDSIQNPDFYFLLFQSNLVTYCKYI